MGLWKTYVDQLTKRFFVTFLDAVLMNGGLNQIIFRVPFCWILSFIFGVFKINFESTFL